MSDSFVFYNLTTQITQLNSDDTVITVVPKEHKLSLGKGQSVEVVRIITQSNNRVFTHVVDGDNNWILELRGKDVVGNIQLDSKLHGIKDITDTRDVRYEYKLAGMTFDKAHSPTGYWTVEYYDTSSRDGDYEIRYIRYYTINGKRLVSTTANDYDTINIHYHSHYHVVNNCFHIITFNRFKNIIGRETIDITGQKSYHEYTFNYNITNLDGWYVDPLTHTCYMQDSSNIITISQDQEPIINSFAYNFGIYNNVSTVFITVHSNSYAFISYFDHLYILVNGKLLRTIRYKDDNVGLIGHNIQIQLAMSDQQLIPLIEQHISIKPLIDVILGYIV